jgi:RNA polymerase sigma-70 factor, ECF subfamily
MNEALRKELLAHRMTGKSAHTDPSESRPARLKENQAAQNLSRQFDEIFLAHWTQVVALLTRLVGDPDEAEDLALETFIRFHDRYPGETKSQNLGGWLYRVATNLGLDAIRSWKRRERYEVESGKVFLTQNTPVNPAEMLAAEEERRSVRKILSEMNPRMAQLLILRYSGLAYQEIAVVLTTAPASIGPLLLRAEKEFERRYRAANLEE